MITVVHALKYAAFEFPSDFSDCYDVGLYF